MKWDWNKFGVVFHILVAIIAAWIHSPVLIFTNIGFLGMNVGLIMSRGK